MILEHIGLSQINGSLVVLDGVKGVQYDEMAELHLDDGSTRVGRVVRVDGDRCVIQVFEGTRGLSLVNNRTVLAAPSTASVTFTPSPAAMSTARPSTPSAVSTPATTSTPAFLRLTAWPR